jgi:hypothetical protein
VLPDVEITATDCREKGDLLTVDGAGFGGYLPGTDAVGLYVNRGRKKRIVTEACDLIVWSDTRLRAECPTTCCAEIEVRSVFGVVTAPAPCRGGGKGTKGQ